MPPPEVEVLAVAGGDATLTRDLPGRVQAYRTAQVRARVDGVVEQRVFREGSAVRAGETLFRIDARTYRAQAEAARAAATLARQDAERYRTLLDSGAVSQQAYEQAEAQARQAEAARVAAEEDVEQAAVPAPISGQIGRSEVTEGALVSKNAATLLATIEQLDTVYVNFSQSAMDVLRLRKALAGGQMKAADSSAIELLLEDGSVYAHSGKITFSDLAVEANTGAVSMRAVFPNPKHELLPGMFVRLRFPEAVAGNVIKVPQRAVVPGAGGQMVMVVGADNKVTPRPVVTAGMSGPDFIVSSGLQPGDQVIVNGLQKARPGTEVNPVPLGAAMKMDQHLPAAK